MIDKTKMTYSDETAIKALKIDDEKAYSWIYNKYVHQLRSHAAKIVGYDHADNMVQDLFTILWSKRENIHITTSLRDYLHKSIRNICLNFQKQKKTEREHIEYALDTNDNSGLFQVFDDNDSSSILIAKDTESKINNEIDALPDQRRRVFLMWWKEGLKYDENAKRLGISTDAIGVQINRARTKLRKSLE